MPSDLAAAPGLPPPGAAGARLAKLFDRHGRMVLAVCRLQLRGAADAEDAAQQTFLSAYRALLSGTEPRDPGAWLATIARNECRARARARAQWAELGEETAVLADGPEEAAVRREQMAALYAALAELPERQREAVVLRDLYGLRYGEVGAALGLSLPAVEALLFRARRRLQGRLRPAAAAALVVPLALRESLAQAIPGFETASAVAGAGAAAGVVAKVASAPLAAKIAAATVAVTSTATAVAIRDRDRIQAPPPAPAPAAAVDVAEAPKAPPPIAAAPIAAVSRATEKESREADDPPAEPAARREPEKPEREQEAGEAAEPEQRQQAEAPERTEAEAPERAETAEPEGETATEADVERATTVDDQPEAETETASAGELELPDAGSDG